MTLQKAFDLGALLLAVNRLITIRLNVRYATGGAGARALVLAPTRAHTRGGERSPQSPVPSRAPDSGDCCSGSGSVHRFSLAALLLIGVVMGMQRHGLEISWCCTYVCM